MLGHADVAWRRQREAVAILTGLGWPVLVRVGSPLVGRVGVAILTGLGWPVLVLDADAAVRVRRVVAILTGLGWPVLGRLASVDNGQELN